MYQIVLFDLDGTLTDSGLGITNAVAYALDKFGIQVKDHSELNVFVGPPLKDSFMRYYGLTPEECIVPVIVIHRKNKPVQLSYKIDNKKLLSMGGKATLRVEFNSPVQSLQIITNNGECECIQNNVKEWMAHFSNLHEGEAELEIIADNKMLTPKKIIQVGSRGLQMNSMGLGGLL